MFLKDVLRGLSNLYFLLSLRVSTNFHILLLGLLLNRFFFSFRVLFLVSLDSRSFIHSRMSATSPDLRGPSGDRSTGLNPLASVSSGRIECGIRR